MKLDSLVDVESLQNETSAIQTLADNNDKLTEAFTNTLSRDGSTPNAMGANLDMGSYRIINLAAPQNANDAVRKTDLDQATGGLDDDLIDAILAAPDHATDAAASAAAAAASAQEASEYIGAATSAQYWTTARTITLTGVLSGSQSFDGSANFSLSASYVDGTITSAKLASGVAVANLGYTPANKAGDTLTGELILAPSSLTSVYAAGFRGVPFATQDDDYTFVLADAGQGKRHTSGTAHAYTVPPNASVSYPIGTALVVRNVGAGVITLTQGAGVSIRLPGSATASNKSLAQWGFVTLIKEDTNDWVAVGSGVT